MATIRKKKILKIAGIGSGFIAFGFFSALVVLYLTLPDVTKLRDYLPSQTSVIYDNKNQVLAKLSDEENRQVIPLEQIPVHLRNAVVSMEDERFYTHEGVDLKATARAFVSIFDPTGKMVKSGGSTITQQLARNVFLTQDRTIKRKISEILLAYKIDSKFTKSQILELYLNEIYWGHNTYGIETASRNYFGKSAKDLTLAESTLIAGILGAPEVYSPHKSMEKAKWRQELTLEKMVQHGHITESEAEKVKDTKVQLTSLKNNYSMKYPYFTSYVIARLYEKYDPRYLTRGGLKIYTTINADAQVQAEKLIKQAVNNTGRYRNFSQGALVSVDPRTGHIKALVGGADYNKSQFNRITQAKRQPGSAFKPFIYLTAFNEGIFNPFSTVTDAPVTFAEYDNWSPKNYSGGYRGEMSVKNAIQYSVNTIAVDTMARTGIEDVIGTAHKLGISTPVEPVPALALGATEVIPLELAGAYGVFATGGKKVREITPILKILDNKGRVIEDNSEIPLDEIESNTSVSMLNESLIAVVSQGTGTGAYLRGRIAAGKTGTTSDYKDAWFVGYIPQLVTLVWVGNDDNQKMKNVTGGDICAPIWRRYMTVAARNLPVEDFPGRKEWREIIGFKDVAPRNVYKTPPPQAGVSEAEEESNTATPTEEPIDIVIESPSPNPQENLEQLESEFEQLHERIEAEEEKQVEQLERVKEKEAEKLIKQQEKEEKRRAREAEKQQKREEKTRKKHDKKQESQLFPEPEKQEQTDEEEIKVQMEDNDGNGVPEEINISNGDG